MLKVKVKTVLEKGKLTVILPAHRFNGLREHINPV